MHIIYVYVHIHIHTPTHTLPLSSSTISYCSHGTAKKTEKKRLVSRIVQRRALSSHYQTVHLVLGQTHPSTPKKIYFSKSVTTEDCDCEFSSVCDWCHWHWARKSERFISYPNVPRRIIKHHQLRLFSRRTSDCNFSLRRTVASKVQTQSLLKVLCSSINLRTVSFEQCLQCSTRLGIKFHDANKWHQTWLSLGPCVCCGTLLGAPSDTSQNQIPTLMYTSRAREVVRKDHEQLRVNSMKSFLLLVALLDQEGSVALSRGPIMHVHRIFTSMPPIQSWV